MSMIEPMGVSVSFSDPLNVADDGRWRHLPQAGPRSAWVYIRALGRVYRAEVVRTLPIGDGRLLQWPRCFSQLGPESTLGDLIGAVELGCRRVIWHPFEDFLRVPANVVLHLDRPREYVCVRTSKSRTAQLELGRVTYSGPSPTTGHGIGQFELAFGGRHSPQRLTVDRLAEAQHLAAVAFGLAPRESSVTYLCELP
jgi:hypothetical protein